MDVQQDDIKPLPMDRKVVWKNLCMLDSDYIECIVEMSSTEFKFYIVVLDLLAQKFHTVELSHKQFIKLFRICD